MIKIAKGFSKTLQKGKKMIQKISSALTPHRKNFQKPTPPNPPNQTLAHLWPLCIHFLDCNQSGCLMELSDIGAIVLQENSSRTGFYGFNDFYSAGNIFDNNCDDVGNYYLSPAKHTGLAFTLDLGATYRIDDFLLRNIDVIPHIRYNISHLREIRPEMGKGLVWCWDVVSEICSMGGSKRFFMVGVKNYFANFIISSPIFF